MKSYYRFEISRKNFWAILVPSLLAGCILIVVLAYYLVNSVVMPKFTDLSNKHEVAVPNLVGKTYEDARQKCYDKQLRLAKLSDEDKEYNDTIKSNVVILQKPLSGEKVKKGRAISVLVSKGKEIAEVPKVDGLKMGAAKLEIKDAGFENYSVENVFDPKVKYGHVVRTEPEGGLKTSRDVTVVLHVSRGRIPSYVNVPDLVGETFATAKKKIANCNLEIGDVSYIKNEKPGIVMKQSLTAEKNAKVNSKIDLIVGASK